MQHLKKIQKMTQNQKLKRYSNTTIKMSKKKQKDSQNSNYSILSTDKDNELYTIKNLDQGKISIINNQADTQQILKDIEIIKNDKSIIDYTWQTYLSQYQKAQQQFLEACYQGNINIVKKVINSKISHPIDPKNIVTTQGKNGIHLATMSGVYKNIQIIQLLVKSKVNINGKTYQQGRTPLMLAAILGNQIAMKVLIQFGADLNLVDNQGNTALHYAYAFNQTKIIDLLLNNKAQQNIKNKKNKLPNEHSMQSKAKIKKQIHSQQQLIHKNNPQNQSHSQKSDETLQISTNPRQQIIACINIKQIDQHQLHNFQKISILGRGAFGQVYLVRNKITQKLYAIKCLDKKFIMGQNILRYVLTQRKILSTINHPFIVKLYYAFQNKDKLFLVMNYCSSGDMMKLLKNKGPIKEDLLRMYISEIVLALEQLHKAQIIYRDLKPGNIVIDSQGHVCLTDFGLSKEASLAHSFCGSTAYLAPQMLWRKGHTKVLDWYLLGVLIYECLVGKPPFWNNNKEQLLTNIRSGRYKPLNNDFSQQVRDLVTNLLNTNASKRLGANGSNEIKQHPWFKNINWQSVFNRQQAMPILPPAKGIPIDQKCFQLDNNNQNRVEGWQYIPQN